MFLISGLAHGQESSIYNNNGKLKIDSTYSINPSRINDFLKIEKYFLPDIFNRLEYPFIASKYGIEGIVIAKVTIDKGNITHVQIVRYLDKFVEKSVISAIDTTSFRNKINEFTKINAFTIINIPFVFYIPFKFKLLDDTFQKDLNIWNSIVVRTTSGTLYYERQATFNGSK